MIENLRFSLFELLALIGLVQSVSVLVYMAFRSGHIAHAVIPVLYFSVMGSAFYAEFAEVFIPEYYHIFHWAAFFLWASVPALSVLLIVQLARSPRYPHIAYYSFLLLPVILLAAFAYDSRYNDGVYLEYLPILSIVFGAITLLGLWVKRDLLTQLYDNKANAGADRYWLSMALIFFNVLFIAGLFLESLGAFQANIWDMLRLIVTNVFVYLASTSLFRIYPQAFFVAQSEQRRSDDGAKQALNAEELDIVARLIALFDVEKVYQEASLTRTELAQELKISEGLLSRLVSTHYNKSVPQLINSYRVQDAAVLIAQTGAPIKDIAQEAGFSSIATFNRVFKEITGQSPSAYRKEASNIIH